MGVGVGDWDGSGIEHRQQLQMVKKGHQAISSAPLHLGSQRSFTSMHSSASIQRMQKTFRLPPASDNYMQHMQYNVVHFLPPRSKQAAHRCR